MAEVTVPARSAATSGLLAGEGSSHAVEECLAAPRVEQDDAPLILGDKGPGDVSDDVCGPLERGPTWLWWMAFLSAASALTLGAVCVAYQVATGIGTWGLNRTVGWAFDITNFVFWVGIGHAGTLISAVLFLLRQRWRTSINRSAEAMTIFAVICAGLFPLIHMGRPWLAHWVFPYPNFRGPLWVNFRSPLLWDVFAIGTYFTISAVFWYIGLIPDLATVRDRARGLRKKVFGLLSCGWTGKARTWSRWEMTSLLLAALATPLVVSVHSVVSTDFATAVVPGWHTTVFPPYFVIGAVFSGFAMVLMLMLIARRVMNLTDYITMRHIHAMCRVIVFTGSIVGIAYATELFVSWYSGSEYERFAFNNRMFGPMGWAYGIMVLCNVVVPQLLWFKRVRSSIPLIFLITVLVNVGMWFERFVIIVSSLSRDFLPSAWASYSPTLIELGTLLGSFGLFFTLFLLFCRFLPMIAMSEVRHVTAAQREEARGHGAGHGLDESEPLPVMPAESASSLRHYAAFADGGSLLAAAREGRRKGLRLVDALTPNPVHGLDPVLGIRRSRLPFVTLICGASGAAIALFFQYWSSAGNWPLDVGGKPFDSLPAFVPIAFELLILLAGLGTAAALLIRSRLGPGARHKIVHERASSDRYVLVVECANAAVDEESLGELWDRHGALETWWESHS